MDSTEEKTPLEKAAIYERAVLRHNDINAMISLGFLLLYDDNFAADRERGVQMLERAVKQGNSAYAMYSLADYMIFRGKRSKAENRRVHQLLERSLRLEESVPVLTLLTNCYLHGKISPKDHTLAVALAERALRVQRTDRSRANLAYALLKSPACRAQRKRAVALYRKAIRNSSSAEWMNELGLFYQEGVYNLPACRRRATKWYRRAIRAAEYAPSMFNLAVLLLEDNPSADDFQEAIRLLERALDLEKGRDEDTFFYLAKAYAIQGVNAERAFELYQIGAIRFNSKRARDEIATSIIHGIAGVRFACSRIFRFCWKDFKQNNNLASLLIYTSMLWTGAPQVEMHQKRAAKLLLSNRGIDRKYICLALRHDPSTYPTGEKNGLAYVKEFTDHIERSNPSAAEALLLSESKCENDRLVALKSFRALIDDEQNGDGILWIGFQLRKGRYRLPFDGSLDCVTNPMRIFTTRKNVTALNLASLLLEFKGREHEAVAILEDMMNTDLRLIAMLNLTYLLTSDVTGVRQDRTRAMQLLQDAVNETNDVSARAMLANALSEGDTSDERDVERGFKLWREVEEELNDNAELRKVRRLVSHMSEKKWAILCKGDNG